MTTPRRIKDVLLLVLSFLVSSMVLLAERIELEPLEDVAIRYSINPPVRQNLLNSGAARSLSASLYNGTDRGTCSLLRFDIGKIPAGATIEKVSLILTPVHTYQAKVYSGGERLVVYQLVAENAGWVEGKGESLADLDTITTPGATGAYVNLASFQDDTHHKGTRWLNGKFIGTMDFDVGPLGRYSLSENGLSNIQTVEIVLPPGLIEAWRKNPELAKAGLVLRMESDEKEIPKSRFATFESREGNAPPKLVIETR